MSLKYKEYKGLNLPNVATEVMEKWKANSVFEQSVTSRDEKCRSFNQAEFKN